MGDLTENFSMWEFTCRCGCGICIIDAGFLLKLQYARKLAGIAFTITSGCRCLSHNKAEGGSEESDHLTTETLACEGVDILCNNSHNRYKIVNAAIIAGFKRIGLHKTFIHLGLAQRNPQEVLWVY